MNTELHETLKCMKQQLDWAIKANQAGNGEFSETVAEHLHEIAELNEQAVNQNIATMGT